MVGLPRGCRDCWLRMDGLATLRRAAAGRFLIEDARRSASHASSEMPVSPKLDVTGPDLRGGTPHDHRQVRLRLHHLIGFELWRATALAPGRSSCVRHDCDMELNSTDESQATLPSSSCSTPQDSARGTQLPLTKLALVIFPHRLRERRLMGEKGSLVGAMRGRDLSRRLDALTDCALDVPERGAQLPSILRTRARLHEDGSPTDRSDSVHWRMLIHIAERDDLPTDRKANSVPEQACVFSRCQYKIDLYASQL